MIIFAEYFYLIFKILTCISFTISSTRKPNESFEKGLFLVNISKAGMEYFFVELDNSKRPALESIKISYDYLNGSLFIQ